MNMECWGYLGHWGISDRKLISYLLVDEETTGIGSRSGRSVVTCGYSCHNGLALSVQSKIVQELYFRRPAIEEHEAVPDAGLRSQFVIVMTQTCMLYVLFRGNEQECKSRRDSGGNW